MKEKEPIVCNQDYGKDEDSSEALLKKHEALVSDLEAFGNTVSALKEQAAACRVSCLSLRFFLCVTGKLMSVWFTATSCLLYTSPSPRD